MVLAPCNWDNEAGITNFETPEALFENCISEFIWTFGRRAFRRPITWEQHASLMEIFYSDIPQYDPSELQQNKGYGLGVEQDEVWRRIMRNTIATILNSPFFLYHIELGDEAGNLTAHELANRLSYTSGIPLLTRNWPQPRMTTASSTTRKYTKLRSIVWRTTLAPFPR